MKFFMKYTRYKEDAGSQHLRSHLKRKKFSDPGTISYTVILTSLLYLGKFILFCFKHFLCS